jgi:hypothetical protein
MFGKGNPFWGWAGLLAVVVIIIEILRGCGFVKSPFTIFAANGSLATNPHPQMKGE